MYKTALISYYRKRKIMQMFLEITENGNQETFCIQSVYEELNHRKNTREITTITILCPRGTFTKNVYCIIGITYFQYRLVQK